MSNISKKCLVIIDVQNGFYTKRTFYAYQDIQEYLNKYAAKYDYIVATQFKGGSRIFKELNWGKMTTPDEQKIFNKIKQFIQKIFIKKSYTCFTPEFEYFLLKNKITDLFFIGVDTDCCVLKSALDAFEKGYKPKVIINLCATNGGNISDKAAITVLKRTIGKNNLMKIKQ